MNRIIFLIIVLISTSCLSKDYKIQGIIDDSYYGIHNLMKMGEIDKLKEDIFSLSVHYTVVEKYAQAEKDHEYEIVRYIYKTDKGAHRMFYLVDLTEEKIIDKSSDYNDFFRPIVTEIFGERDVDYRGDNLMELMRY